ncbi:ABC transporter permease [Ruminiclostridium josui]|uniref:ABC transporter permease n=1 Tax=Ruminiclostridium josui TaxID=1499 RepID=UPI0006D0D0CA|nr:ABC transporter permease [Ruminiclostridium josui]
MKLAWKEIKHSKSKYVLIESILILMIFMVVFLSGLANGLGWAISASIEKRDAEYFVMSTDAEKLISISNINTDVLEKVASQTSNNVTNLNIKRSNINTLEDEQKLDITYFVINPSSFLSPDATEGTALSNSSAEYPILLDDSFKEKDIDIGDVIEDSVTGLSLTVVGFTHDEIYGHSPVGFIGADTFTTLNLKVNSSYTEKYNAIAVQGSDIENINIKGLEVVDKATVIDNLPGYAAEQLTIKMILWVLVIISAAVLGVFFYVITIQKQKQFGVLKAIGMKMSELARYIMHQVLILSAFGVLVGNLIAVGMASMLK